MVSFGPYHLVLELGRGGMATAYLAVLGDEVTATPHLRVVKRMKRDLLAEDQHREMFTDELSLSLQLTHPNIVTTHQVGIVEDEYFLEMEYLDGVPLSSARLMARKNAEDKALLAELEPYVMHEVLQALHYAHTATLPSGEPLEVVHRDVSPHNVFLTYDGRVKLLDFGVAKMSHRTHQTSTGVIKGKVRYMAPEQLLGARSIDARADLFAVGVMLWEGVAGRPFWGRERLDPDIMASLISGAFASALPEDVSGAASWQDVLDKALASQPDARFASARDFAIALRSPPRRLDIHADRERLAAFLDSRFVERRKVIREAIESALHERRARAASGRVDSSGVAIAPVIMTNNTSNTPSGASPRNVSGPPDEVAPPASSPTERPPSPSRGRRAGLVVGAGIVLAAAIIVGRMVGAPAPASSAGRAGEAPSGAASELRAPDTAAAATDAPLPPNAEAREAPKAIDSSKLAEAPRAPAPPAVRAPRAVAPRPSVPPREKQASPVTPHPPASVDVEPPTSIPAPARPAASGPSTHGARKIDRDNPFRRNDD